MKLLLRCEHALQAQHYANVLRAAGIGCEVRSTALAGALGDIPWLECAPQLWLQNAIDEARARELLAQLEQPVRGLPWCCPHCGETSEPQFGACWKCGADRPLEG